MPGGIDGLGLTPQNQPQIQDGNQAQQVVGQHQGQKVMQLPNESSLIEQAMEELPANLSETKSKKLADRTAKKGSSSRIQEIMQKFLKHIGGVKQTEKLDKLHEQLKELKNPSKEQIKEKLNEFFGGGDDEAIEEYRGALLLALEEIVAGEPDSEDLLKAIQEAKQDFGNELREFFESEVVSYEGLNDVYEGILGEHGPKDFSQAIDQLIKRLGNDLQGSNIDPVHIKNTVDSLFHLEVAKNTFSTCQNLVSKMHNLFDVSLAK